MQNFLCVLSDEPIYDVICDGDEELEFAGIMILFILVGTFDVFKIFILKHIFL